MQLQQSKPSRLVGRSANSSHGPRHFKLLLRASQVHTEVSTASAGVEGHVSAAPESPGRCPVLSELPLAPAPVMGPLEDLIRGRLWPNTHLTHSQAGRPVTRGRFVGLMPAVLIGNMIALKDVLAHEAAGVTATAWPESTRKLLGEYASTVVNDVGLYRFLRKMLAGPLGQDAVDSYLPEIHNICIQRLERWVSECEAGRTVTARPELRAMTVEVMSKCVLDMPLNEKEQADVGHDFDIWLKSLFTATPVDMWPLPFYHSMRARERIVARIEKRMEELKQEEASGHELKRISMPLRLMNAQDENGRKLTHKQVVDNLLNMLFAGHETTAGHLTGLMLILARHPQVLAKVRAEQQQVIARHGPHMTPAALKDMKYTSAVLQETHRTRPIVPFAPRVAKEDVAVGGYKVPAGQTLVLHYGYMIRNDPRWPAEGDANTNPLHPANFTPERFLTEEGQKQGSQVPWGAGQRTCAGMGLAIAESKVFLATLARGYDLLADINVPNDLFNNPLPLWVTRHADARV